MLTLHVFILSMWILNVQSNHDSVENCFGFYLTRLETWKDCSCCKNITANHNFFGGGGMKQIVFFCSWKKTFVKLGTEPLNVLLPPLVVCAAFLTTSIYCGFLISSFLLQTALWRSTQHVPLYSNGCNNKYNNNKKKVIADQIWRVVFALLTVHRINHHNLREGGRSLEVDGGFQEIHLLQTDAGVSLQYFSHRKEILQTAAASLKLKRNWHTHTYRKNHLRLSVCVIPHTPRVFYVNKGLSACLHAHALVSYYTATYSICSAPSDVQHEQVPTDFFFSSTPCSI